MHRWCARNCWKSYNMADKLMKEISPLVRIAADKANQELGNVKGLLSGNAGNPILSKYEESEINRNNSFVDPLTGLLNRRGLAEEYKLGTATRDRLKSNGDKVLIALDLIGLKKINIELSPAVADEVLKKAGELLRGQIRESDLVARWGGDEFLLVLFGAGKESALVVIQKILANLPEHVHYNIGYQIFEKEGNFETQTREVMDWMEEIKRMGGLDKTGRATGSGIVIDVDSLKK